MVFSNCKKFCLRFTNQLFNNDNAQRLKSVIAVPGTIFETCNVKACNNAYRHLCWYRYWT
jgi:hypothetical protein